MEISNLPDDLILDIMRLSSMKARAAVQTSVFCKRWKNLWAYLPDLNFDIEEFNSGYPQQDKLRFSRFVTTMLERRKTLYLDKFRLSCENLCEQYTSSIKKWIMYALENQVRVLELALCVWNASMVNPDVFTCDSLEKLHLHLNYNCRGFDDDTVDIVVPRIHLPRLRKLHLRGEGLTLSNSSFFWELFSGCPVIEDLCLESFAVRYPSMISSQTIKHLTFKNCNFTSVVIVSAPSLVSLCFFGSIQYATKLFCAKNRISSSLRASISLCDDGAAVSSSVIVRSLSCVDTLELYVFRFNPISNTTFLFCTLPLINTLSFCGHSFDYFSCLWKYLPNLKKLILWLSCQYSHQHCHQGLKWDNLLSKALTQCKKLNVVEVIFARFDDEERQLVEDLHKLKNVKIVTSNKDSFTLQRFI